MNAGRGFDAGRLCPTLMTMQRRVVTWLDGLSVVATLRRCFCSLCITGELSRYCVTKETKMHQNDPKKFYDLIMDSKLNPLSRIPDLNARHMVMQLLAWMWCIVFSSWVGSILAFGISALVHAILLAGVFITLATFETARRKPAYFGTLGRANNGEHE